MITIYDIAKTAGVSPATVSKVFNNYSEVGQKTKDRVLKIAREMNYVPNMSAQSLKTKNSFLVGVIFSENMGIGLDHQFFSIVLESFRKEIGNYGYDTIFINNTLGNNKIGYLDHCQYRNVDGAFIITAQPDDLDIGKLLSSKIYCVTTDIIYGQRPYVASDNPHGGYLAVRYLFDKGHKKIAFISGPLTSLSSQERFAGYKLALEKLAIPYDERYYCESKRYHEDDSYMATSNLLNRFEKNPEDRPTAIFVGADILALGAMKAIREMGLKIPYDISIVGFDDIPMAKHVRPALTTIQQNKILIGKTVADILYRLMKQKSYSEAVPRIPVTLVERDSVFDISK